MNAVEMSPQIDDDSMGDLRLFLPSSVSEIQCFNSGGGKKAIGWPRHKNKANNNRQGRRRATRIRHGRGTLPSAKTPFVIACMKGQEPNAEEP